MSRIFLAQGAHLVLTGDTFPIKEQIKELGGRWDRSRKCWLITSSNTALQGLTTLGFVPAEPMVQAAAASSLACSTDLTPKTWSVREFVSLIQGIIQENLSGEYWITGEISSLKTSNGHTYFDLSENEEELAGLAGKASSVCCILWSGKRRQLTTEHGEIPLAEGLKVRVLVHCEFRRETSRINAVVSDIDLAFTMGDLALNRQAIIRELRRRNLYDRNRQLELPELPIRVALITAQNSRAASDFLDELKQSGFAFEVTLFDAHMQGDKTSPNVCSSFQAIAERATNFDCVVLTRGGGSRLDLRWFDDLEICKQIAYCPLPVITAIGHFEDVSVADEVSYLAEKTPTGAARFLANAATETLSQLYVRAEQVSHRLLRRLALEREGLAKKEKDLLSAVSRKISNEKTKLSGFEQALRLVRSSTDKALARGFALLQGEDGRPLTAASFLSQHRPDRIVITLQDGSSGSLVELDAAVQNVRIKPVRE